MEKKGSKVVLVWNEKEVQHFLDLKLALTKELALYQVQPDKPFVLKTDASKGAIGAVLEQQLEDQWYPVGFMSRKLTGSQRNWSPREQETYAIVMALRKWASWIGFQPVLILTDHRALEHWATEFVDTPSGPAGRRARWHETLSKFDLEVKYIPGKSNFVADCMSRYAYPASKSLQDCCSHGSLQDHEDMKEILTQEVEEEAKEGKVGFLHMEPEGKGKNILVVYGQPESQVRPITRSGKVVRLSDSDSESEEEEPESPPAGRTRSKTVVPASVVPAAVVPAAGVPAAGVPAPGVPAPGEPGLVVPGISGGLVPPWSQRCPIVVPRLNPFLNLLLGGKFPGLINLGKFLLRQIQEGKGLGMMILILIKGLGSNLLGTPVSVTLQKLLECRIVYPLEVWGWRHQCLGVGRDLPLDRLGLHQGWIVPLFLGKIGQQIMRSVPLLSMPGRIVTQGCGLRVFKF